MTCVACSMHAVYRAPACPRRPAGAGCAVPKARARPAPAPLRPDAGVEALLHASCVKAGAAAALLVALERLPMLRPLLPRAITDHARGDAAERIQRLLVKEIYLRYRVKPAAWEIEGILAVADARRAGAAGHAAE